MELFADYRLLQRREYHIKKRVSSLLLALVLLLTQVYAFGGVSVANEATLAVGMQNIVKRAYQMTDIVSITIRQSRPLRHQQRKQLSVRLTAAICITIGAAEIIRAARSTARPAQTIRANLVLSTRSIRTRRLVPSAQLPMMAAMSMQMHPAARIHIGITRLL